MNAYDSQIGEDCTKYRVQSFLLAITVIITALAALPVFSGSESYKIVLLLAWALNFLYNVVVFKISFSKTGIAVLSFWFLYAAYCIVMNIVKGHGYITGIYFYYVNLSIFIFVNGCFLSHIRMKKALDTVIMVYIACSAIVMLYVYFTNFQGFNYLYVQQYVYGSKNSIGPIIISNFIILTIRGKRGSSFVRSLSFIYRCFLIYLLLLVNNRAGFVELIVVLIFYLIFIEKKSYLKHTPRDAKVMAFGIFMLCFILLLCFMLDISAMIGEAASFFKWALKLDALQDLDKFSSGRILLYHMTVDYAVKTYLLFGTGQWYVDFFILSAVAELGLIGSMPLFFIILLILAAAVSNMKRQNNYSRLLVLLIVQVLTAMLFEALPPFGPGTVVFMFWLMYGANSGSRNVT